jgi:hypothetical protein
MPPQPTFHLELTSGSRSERRRGAWAHAYPRRKAARLEEFHLDVVWGGHGGPTGSAAVQSRSCGSCPPSRARSNSMRVARFAWCLRCAGDCLGRAAALSVRCRPVRSAVPPRRSGGRLAGHTTRDSPALVCLLVNGSCQPAGNRFVWKVAPWFNIGEFVNQLRDDNTVLQGFDLQELSVWKPDPRNGTTCFRGGDDQEGLQSEQGTDESSLR